MPDYDFATLSPHDFEILTRDLLQQEWGVALESFKSGRDGGIDLRYSRPKSQATEIVQCKHYYRSGFASLKSKLKNEELKKIKKLSASRYVLATSVSLSPNDKDELLAILAPYCQSSADIIGKEDLNNLLGKHERVERSHFKLWLPSTSVLHRLLHNGVFTQSAFEIEDIKRHLSLFVPTPAVERGMEMLDKSGFCMLTGIPGIGKTVTARVLVAQHIEQDWEGIYLSSNASEAFDVFNPEQKQIFFYDDFLGQTSLQEKLVKNEDKRLLQLIGACQKNPKTKRLVLTTREYLFEQARQQHELLSRNDIRLAECTVQLRDYTEKIRAQILVNHLYFFGVDADVCSHFVESGTGRKTLNHTNYNPRIVETMCALQQRAGYSSNEFSERFIEMLDDPDVIWSHAYENQLSEEARLLLLVFSVLGNFCTLEALRQEFGIYCEKSGIGQVGLDAKITRSLEELEGNFISIDQSNDTTFITYHTPSIKDFTDRQLKQEIPLLKMVLSEFSYDEALLSAATILTEDKSPNVSGSELLSAMQRGDCTTPFKVKMIGRAIAKGRPTERTETLKSWLGIMANADEESSLTEAITYVEQFIRDVDPQQYSLSSLIELYQDYLLVVNQGDEHIEAEEFVTRVVKFCEDPDDYVSLGNLSENSEQSKELQAALCERFNKEIFDWLGDTLDSVNSSDEADAAIASAKDAAELMKVEVELDLFEERAQEMAQHEDMKADMEMDYHKEMRYEERMEREEVDDILNSLRD